MVVELLVGVALGVGAIFFLLFAVIWPKRDWYVVQRLFYDFDVERKPARHGLPVAAVAKRGTLDGVYRHGFADYQAALAFYEINEGYRGWVARSSESVHQIFVVTARSKFGAISRFTSENRPRGGELLMATPYEALSDARKAWAADWDALHPAD